MVSNCADMRDAVALCLQRSECVMVNRHKPIDCMMNPELRETLPQPCIVHIFRYFDCKRGQADMGRRFRGNGALSSGKYVEDLHRLQMGDFDPEVELGKLSADEHVTPKRST